MPSDKTELTLGRADPHDSQIFVSILLQPKSTFHAFMQHSGGSKGGQNTLNNKGLGGTYVNSKSIPGF